MLGFATQAKLSAYPISLSLSLSLSLKIAPPLLDARLSSGSRSNEMARKSKKADKNNTRNLNSDGDPNSGSDSSSISGTLLKDRSDQQQNSVSILSEKNPFRRKPQQQPRLGFGTSTDVEKATNGECEDSSILVVKKRKWGEEKPSLDAEAIDDDDSGIGLEIKKSRRDEFGSPDFSGGWEEKGEGGSSDSGANLKRGEGKEHPLGSESKELSESGKEPDLGSKLEDVLKQVYGKNLHSGIMERKKNKKRKRDEIVAGYEESRYAVVGMSNECGEGGLRGRVVGEKRKKVDDPVDMMMVSQEGFDDEEKLLRTVFVGNLPLMVKKKILFKEFSQFGEIESVRFRSIPILDTKIPRKCALIQKKTSDAVDSVHAYIIFKTEGAAQASLAHNMALVGGNHVRVDRACPPRKKLKGEDDPLYGNERTVFVGNLPSDVKDEVIYQLFSGIEDLEASIELIRVIRDSGSSMGKAIAYVWFKTRGDANMVAEKQSLKFRCRKLGLHRARTNLVPSKRKYSSTDESEDSRTKKLRTTDSSNGVETKSASSYHGLQASKSGASEQFGIKRKLENQTPESSRWNKKSRKLR